MTEDELAKLIKNLVKETVEKSEVHLDLSKKLENNLEKKLSKYQDKSDEIVPSIKKLVEKAINDSKVTLNLSEKFLKDLNTLLKKYEEYNTPTPIATEIAIAVPVYAEKGEYFDKDVSKGEFHPAHINRYTKSIGGKTKRKYRHKKRTLRH